MIDGATPGQRLYSAHFNGQNYHCLDDGSLTVGRRLKRGRVHRFANCIQERGMGRSCTLVFREATIQRGYTKEAAQRDNRETVHGYAEMHLNGKTLVQDMRYIL